MSGFKVTSLLFTFLFHFSFAQNFELDTREIKDLVKKWNYANNWRSEETFRTIYDDELIFYAQNLSRERCIALKQRLFRQNPEFKQKIISDPIFTPYTSGIIKCDFKKEVFQKNVWKTYPAYLLISYEKNHYVISGESDAQTDRVMKFALDIGEPMDIPLSKDTASDSAFYADSITTVDRTSNDTTVLADVYGEVLSDETVTVPKKYLYFLIGFLLLTALTVWLSRSSRGGDGRQKKRLGYTNGANGVHNDAVILRGDKDFESFVVSLFDPHYFTLRVLSRQKALVGNGREPELLPHMEFDFHNKSTSARFAVECLYISSPGTMKVMNIFPNDIRRYQHFHSEHGVEVYVVIGLGGEPDNPKEIYLLRSSDVRDSRINYADLQPFRKFGMFFYNSSLQRIQ